MSATQTRPLRIGELAEQTGTTARTIRYYEEIGLLPAGEDREQGKHRVYSEADVERLREIIRLRDLLGLSLDQLAELVEAESARADLRREYHATEDAATRRRLLEQALGHLGRQLSLLARRRSEIIQLEFELLERQQRIHAALDELAQG